MQVLFFTLGIISGLGLSLCYVAAIVIVAYYFDKRRSLATGRSDFPIGCEQIVKVKLKVKGKRKGGRGFKDAH